MKKIVNAIINAIRTAAAQVWPTFLRILRHVIVEVVRYRLYVRKEQFAVRQFFINDEGEVVVWTKTRRMTATEICQMYQTSDGPLMELAAMPGENCTCIRDEIEGIIVTMESVYTADEAILWHELAHAAIQDAADLDSRKFENELDADFVAAGQVGREKAVAALTRVKNQIANYPWWIRLAGDGALEESVNELECRILNLQRIDQKILNLFAAKAQNKVRFIDDEEVA